MLIITSQSAHINMELVEMLIRYEQSYKPTYLWFAKT